MKSNSNLKNKLAILSTSILLAASHSANAVESLKSLESSLESSFASLEEEVVFRPCVGPCQQRLIVAQEIATDILAGYQVSIAAEETLDQMVNELNSLNDSEHQIAGETALKIISSYSK